MAVDPDRLNDPGPGARGMGFPAHDISTVHGRAPIGDKLTDPAMLGPQGAQHQLDGTLSATMYFAAARQLCGDRSHSA